MTKSNCSLPCPLPGLIGHVTGLRARGGFEVELAWQNHKLTTAKILSTGGRKTVVRYGEQTEEIQLKPGTTIRVNPDLRH